VQRHASDDERDAGRLGHRRHLGEDDDPDERRGRGQQGHHERVRRPREAPERELVGDVGDDRRADPDPRAGEQRDGIAERGRGLGDRRGRDRDRGHQHGRGQAVDARERAVLGDAIGQHDVGGEEDGVRAGKREGDRLAAEVHAGDEPHAGRGERERQRIARRARAECGEGDDGQELDGGDRRQG